MADDATIPPSFWFENWNPEAFTWHDDERPIAHAQVIDENGQRQSVWLAARDSQPEHVYYHLNGKVYDFRQSPHAFVAMTQFGRLPTIGEIASLRH